MGGLEAEERLLTGVDDRSLMIIKGKRTKRQRTPSPCGTGGSATAASSSSTSGGGGRGGGGGGDCDFYPSSSSGMTVFRSTEEEEDMAYCLILLARGPGRWREEDRTDERMEDDEFTGSSKKFSEVATTGGATTKAGFYVYECKTCSRTFPSFQALGGHRASHKKPKLTEDTKKSASEPHSDEDIDEEGQLRKISISPPVTSIPNFPSKLPQPSKPKIHECSICGSEFSSGQALGGHMRRHRTVAAPPAMTSHVTMSIDSVITDHHQPNSQTVVNESTSRRNAVLSLDLNLPAPEDDLKFQFASAPAQKPLLFPAPALVDCHY